MEVSRAALLSLIVATVLLWLTSSCAAEAELITETLDIGPIQIDARKSYSNFIANVARPATDGRKAMVKFVAMVYDATKKRNFEPSQLYLHHLVLLNLNETDVLCDPGNQRFVASGAELTEIALPAGYAYMIDQGDKWGATMSLMNKMSKDATVIIRYNVSYYNLSAPGQPQFKAVTPLWFETGKCSKPEWSVPDKGPDSVYIRKKSEVFPFDAKVIYGVGHLHVGGLNISLIDSDNKVHVCDSFPTYSGEYISRMSSCDPNLPLSAGTNLTIQAAYNASKELEDVMGIMILFVDETANSDSGIRWWVILVVVICAAIALGIVAFALMMVRVTYARKPFNYNNLGEDFSHAEPKNNAHVLGVPPGAVDA